MKMMSMPQQEKKTLVISIYLALIVAALLVFWQVRNFDFVDYDDDVYVSDNPHVLNGLTADTVSWAVTTGYGAFWHPLTWLSLILDGQFYGSNPAGYHLTNLFLHLVNTLLLFTVLKKMTGALWQSAFVAALFALHPLHVESVAWISERKDVLSTFFWLLTMLAYWQYVEKPGIVRYLLTLLIFALGLMAKPMLVTLPFVFLLLDYWPLDRIKHFDRQIMHRLMLEKIPFIVLSIVSSVIAFFAQQKTSSISSFSVLPLRFRVANALISYIKYIEKMFWPNGLAPFYPHPVENVSVLYTVISAAVLLAVTIFVILFAKNHRYLVTGWFWYLGTLIPVIGIVQVGGHAMADRYSYITLTGLFIIIAFFTPQLVSRLPHRKIALAVSMIIVLTALGIFAHRQTGFWKNSFALFSHANEVTQNNYVAYNNLGSAYARLGNYTESIKLYSQAIVFKPDYAMANYNLGIVYDKLSRPNEAIEADKQAIRLKSDYAEAYYNLGVVYDKLNRSDEAIEAYNQAIRIRSDYAKPHLGLGVVYGKLSRPAEAIDAYKQAIRIDPYYAEAYNNLGVTYGRLARWHEAIEACKNAVKIKPAYAEAHANLGSAYLSIGDKNSALAELNILKSLNSRFANDLFSQINK